MSGLAYAAPRSVDEAVAMLAGNDGARVLAGGHLLLLEPARSTLGGALLVDLGRIDGLDGISRQSDGSLKIGAMTTLARLAESDLVHPALAAAAGSCGDAQLRNRATLGGSLASGDPESPLAALALVLDAGIEVTGASGAVTTPAGEWSFDRPATAGQVITAVRWPAPSPRTGVAYVAISNPATLHALCGVAAWVELAGDGTVAACRVAVTGAADRPQRLPGVEQGVIAGRAPDNDRLSAAADAAGAGLNMRSDLFASADYRAHLTRVLTRRALRQALGTAQR